MDKTTIIGIDPGTNLLGFGVIDVIGGKPVFERASVQGVA